MLSCWNESNKVDIGQYVKPLMTEKRIRCCSWLI